MLDRQGRPQLFLIKSDETVSQEAVSHESEIVTEPLRPKLLKAAALGGMIAVGAAVGHWIGVFPTEGPTP